MAMKARPWEQRLQSKIEIRDPGECWLWTGHVDLDGYGVLVLVWRPKQEIKAHRAAYMLWSGAIPDGMCVCHACDVRLCCNPAHLFLGSRADNNRDRDQKGRNSALSGESHRSAKLNWKKVAEIRQRRTNGEGVTALAKDYGVAYQVIQAVVARRTWRWPPAEALEKVSALTPGGDL